MPGWQSAPELDFKKKAGNTGSFGATFQVKKKAGTDAKGQFKSLHIDNAESVGNRKIG